MTTTTQEQLEGLGTYKFGWADSDVAGASARRGLSEEVVRDISARKNEPDWMLQMRLKGLKNFGRKPMPNWGADLTGIAENAGAASAHEGRGLLADLFRDMWSLGKPIVARVRGYALAGGFGLACACDMIVASDDAVFGTPEIGRASCRERVSIDV